MSASNAAHAGMRRRTTVAARDPRTLELRNFFPLPDGQHRTASYTIDLFFFFPRSFGLTPDVWGKEAFYRDSQLFLRLDAPDLTLGRLCDLDDLRNPLALLRQRLPALLSEDSPPGEALVVLSQLFGASVSDAMHREGAALMAAMLDPSIESQVKQRRLDDFCRDGHTALVSITRVQAQAQAHRAVAHPALFPSLRFAEEYASSVMEEVISKLGLALESATHLQDGSGDATRMRLTLTRALDLLNQRRRLRGFTLPNVGDSEYYTYRMGRLKKELQRSLYVDTRSTGRDPFLANSAAMVAAGLAATWATLAQVPLLSGHLWSKEGVFLFAGAVGAYVLKDRIKDWVKGRLSRRLIQWDHDHKVEGNALAEVGLGAFSGHERERVRWVDEASLPPEVARLRRAQRTVRGATTELENILHYHQRLNLSVDGGTPPPAGYGILEIVRVSLDDILRRLDQPVESVSFYDETRGRFLVQHMPKVYHLNLVHSVVDTQTGARRLGRTRVVLDQRGVVRLEPVTRRALH